MEYAITNYKTTCYRTKEGDQTCTRHHQSYLHSILQIGEQLFAIVSESNHALGESIDVDQVNIRNIHPHGHTRCVVDGLPERKLLLFN